MREMAHKYQKTKNSCQSFLFKQSTHKLTESRAGSSEKNAVVAVRKNWNKNSNGWSSLFERLLKILNIPWQQQISSMSTSCLAENLAFTFVPNQTYGLEPLQHLFETPWLFSSTMMVSLLILVSRRGRFFRKFSNFGGTFQIPFVFSMAVLSFLFQTRCLHPHFSMHMVASISVRIFLFLALFNSQKVEFFFAQPHNWRMVTRTDRRGFSKRRREMIMHCRIFDDCRARWRWVNTK